MYYRSLQLVHVVSLQASHPGTTWSDLPKISVAGVFSTISAPSVPRFESDLHIRKHHHDCIIFHLLANRIIHIQRLCVRRGGSICNFAECIIRNHDATEEVLEPAR